MLCLDILMNAYVKISPKDIEAIKGGLTTDKEISLEGTFDKDTGNFNIAIFDLNSPTKEPNNSDNDGNGLCQTEI